MNKQKKEVMWEKIEHDIYRFPVPGGWIYMISDRPCFVPKPKEEPNLLTE